MNVNPDKTFTSISKRHFYITNSMNDTLEACNIIAKHYRILQGLRKEDLRADVHQIPNCTINLNMYNIFNDLGKLWERYGIPDGLPAC